MHSATSPLRVGSLVFATDQGLGILAKSFYDNGVVTDVMVVAHGRRPEHKNWYPEAQWLHNLRHGNDLRRAIEFCKSMDVMLFFETPFLWNLFHECKQAGVKTVLMPMYECMPKHIPDCPDLMLCPSKLDLDYYPEDRWTCGTTHSKYLPVPVDTGKVPWRQRTKADVFVHNAGHGGLKGRNGTRELLDALPYIKSPLHLIIRSQEPIDPKALAYDRDRLKVDFRVGSFPYDQLWNEGDVFVFPEKFNGLSLPLQEARAAGMLVMGTNRYPMNDWLPTDPLIPVEGYRRSSVSTSTNEFEEAILSPRSIAARVDEWFGRDISEYSAQGQDWAQRNNWEALKPLYMATLEELCKSK